MQPSFCCFSLIFAIYRIFTWVFQDVSLFIMVKDLKSFNDFFHIITYPLFLVRLHFFLSLYGFHWFYHWITVLSKSTCYLEDVYYVYDCSAWSDEDSEKILFLFLTQDIIYHLKISVLRFSLRFSISCFCEMLIIFKVVVNTETNERYENKTYQAVPCV